MTTSQPLHLKDQVSAVWKARTHKGLASPTSYCQTFMATSADVAWHRPSEYTNRSIFPARIA